MYPPTPPESSSNLLVAVPLRAEVYTLLGLRKRHGAPGTPTLLQNFRKTPIFYSIQCPLSWEFVRLLDFLSYLGAGHRQWHCTILANSVLELGSITEILALPSKILHSSSDKAALTATRQGQHLPLERCIPRWRPRKYFNGRWAFWFVFDCTHTFFLGAVRWQDDFESVNLPSLRLGILALYSLHVLAFSLAHETFKTEHDFVRLASAASAIFASGVARKGVFHRVRFGRKWTRNWDDVVVRLAGRLRISQEIGQVYVIFYSLQDKQTHNLSMREKGRGAFSVQRLHLQAIPKTNTQQRRPPLWCRRT